MQLVQSFKDIINSFLLFFYLLIHDFFQSFMLLRKTLLNLAHLALYPLLNEILLDSTIPQHLTSIQNGARIQTDLLHPLLKRIYRPFYRRQIEELLIFKIYLL